MPELKDKRLVLGLTGGIACYKSAELLRRLGDHGAIVDVVMTDAAAHFITPVTMQALSGRPVHLDAWDNRQPNNMPHINLSRGADAILIAPTSADFMARLVQGRADDLLATLCLARSCPLIIAPAMNREMWDNPATQRNVRQLREDGVIVIGPGSGAQACGETGDGRMLEPAEILAETIAFFQPKVLQGKHVLLTAGPTSEPIDPVRVISNRSSGKTGYALARAAFEAGATVTLISGPTALPAPYGVTVVPVHTARQMYDAVMARVQEADIFVAVAAVADWRVANPAEHKIKKTNTGHGVPVLDFIPNPDILASVAALERGPWCVGFAAETENLIQHAEEKRRRKGIDLLVGNLAQDVMDGDDTRLSLFDAEGCHHLPAADKLSAARRLIGEIARRAPQRHSPLGA